MSIVNANYRSTSPEYFRFYCFTHGSPDGHSGTQGRSRFSNPGRFGYGTSAHPVQYSYNGMRALPCSGHISFLLAFILPLSQKARFD
jgi:hypothetical protein